MIRYFVALLLRRSYLLLTLTFLSLTVGGFLFGVVFSFAQSADRYIVEEGKVLTGGDIVFSSPYRIATATPLLTSLSSKGAVISEGRSLQVVFGAKNSSSTVAAQLRVVSALFPLYGDVSIAGGDSFLMGDRGIYGEKTFLEKLGVSVGDTVTIGGKDFFVRGILEKEPDSVSLGISFAPKVLMLDRDFATLPVDFSQSRTNYKLYLKQSQANPFTSKDIETLKTYAQTNKLRFDDATDGPNSVIRGISSVKDFIGIALAVTLFLVVINIGANLVYVLARFRKTIALLKIHGATTREVQYIFLTLLGGVGAIAGGLGAGVSVSVTGIIRTVVEGVADITLVPISGFLVILLGAMFGYIFVTISSLPFLFAVRKVTAKELLMNQAQRSFSLRIRDVFQYLPIPLLLAGIVYSVTTDIRLAGISVLVCIVLFSVFMMTTYGLVAFLYRFRAKLSFIPRSIVSFLYIRTIRTSITTASIMTALTGVFVVIAVQHMITQNLAVNVSQSAPSLYLIDITKSQREEVSSIVGETYKEYPIVRGRLVSVDGRTITEADGPDLRREFNMTYRDSLIDGETLVDGVFPDTRGTAHTVSIDKKFADDIGGVTLGSKLTVFIQGVTLEAVVASVREVDSTSGMPFFYLVFSSSTLGAFPASYFATADTGDVERVVIENRIGALFPNIIPIATGVIITTIGKLLNSVVTVVTIIGIPSSVLGILLIVVMLWQSLYERSGDVLVMRAFGLKRLRVTLLFILETGILTLVSGFFAYSIAHIVAFLLGHFVFSFTLFSFAIAPLYFIGVLVSIVCVFSFVLSYRLSRVPLKKLLAEK